MKTETDVPCIGAIYAHLPVVPPTPQQPGPQSSLGWDLHAPITSSSTHQEHPWPPLMLGSSPITPPLWLDQQL